MAIEIRQVASEAERREVFRLRYTVYVEEMKDPIRHADHAQRAMEEALDSRGRLLAAFDGGRVVGTARINFAADTDLGQYVGLYGMSRFGPYYPDGISIVTRFAILPEYRKGALATRLMKACYCDEEAIRRGVCFNLIDCKPDHVAFFRRFGYRQVMPNIVNPEAGETHPLVLVVFDRRHLRRVGSPFGGCRESVDENHPSVRFFDENLFPAPAA